MEYAAALSAKVFRLSVKNLLAPERPFMTAVEVQSVRYSVFQLSNVPHVETLEDVEGHRDVPLDPREVFCMPQDFGEGEPVNFEHILPGGEQSPIREIGRLYLVRYEIVPKAGMKQVFSIRLECY